MQCDPTEENELSTAKIVGTTVGVIILVIGISAGVWAFKVGTSEVKGKGDAIIKKNSAENWTKEQAAFESLYAEIVATDRKITVATAALARNPDDRTAQDTLNGTANVCLSFVADYNAKARSYLAESFRSTDLPYQIDGLDVATDCAA